MMRHILALDPARYQRHRIHGENRVWAETNCYVDVWVELLHAWGFEPVAALAFTLAIDFEGDQWTFFKFAHGDLYQLYGLDVQELAVWRPLVRHVEEQVARGRPVLVELDSYYLPDTAGTAYQREHVKSTVAVVAIDVAGQRLGYFHNQGYYHLEGDDFANVFRLRGPKDPTVLPPYVEFVKRGTAPTPEGDELVLASLRLLRRELRHVPEKNPFEAFKARFEADLRWLADEGLGTFHQYSFTTLRQFGACYELAATYLQWLQDRTGKPLGAAVAAFHNLATGAKTLQFHLARAVARKKPLDLSALDGMASGWRSALENLKGTFL
jgi:Domain of unknown function (DUF1839)